MDIEIIGKKFMKTYFLDTRRLHKTSQATSSTPDQLIKNELLENTTFEKSTEMSI